MPSRAVYTALAAARSDTGCSTVMIPWVEESVMVTPEVVGHVDPVGLPGCTLHGKSTTLPAGTAGGAGRGPADAAGSGIMTGLKSAGAAAEAQGGGRVVTHHKGGPNADVHDGQVSCGSVTGAS